MIEGEIHYRVREGVHGEMIVESGSYKWSVDRVVGRAATREDACKLAYELNQMISNKKG
jgi:hypothetical protein